MRKRTIDQFDSSIERINDRSSRSSVWTGETKQKWKRNVLSVEKQMLPLVLISLNRHFSKGFVEKREEMKNKRGRDTSSVSFERKNPSARFAWNGTRFEFESEWGDNAVKESKENSSRRDFLIWIEAFCSFKRCWKKQTQRESRVRVDSNNWRKTLSKLMKRLLLVPKWFLFVSFLFSIDDLNEAKICFSDLWFCFNERAQKEKRNFLDESMIFYPSIWTSFSLGH